MRVTEMESDELVEIAPDAGEILVAGQRAILVDANAMGVLRKDLIDRLGPAAARVVLMRFGFVQGWILAESLQSQFDWDSPDDRLLAGRRALMIEGIFEAAAGSPGLLSPEGSTLVASFEAEQHIAHLGVSTGPTCWIISGLVSGYLSRALDRELFVVEDRCIGKGDGQCSLRAHTRAECGEEILAGWLDPTMHDVTAQLHGLGGPGRRASARGEVVAARPDPLGMVAKSEAMRRLVDLARRIAKVDSTVLITGESGTGKERVARLVHDESARSSGPFIAINCGAITESLLESELFGHARGAFTGAVQHRPGLFEAASGGTLMLDEIGEVTLGTQVKLLRALQEREVRRVGENRNRPTNARVIAATNRDLNVDILSGRFRKDLFYRLNVVELRVPALCDRREDILPLARILLAEAAVRLGRRVTGLSPQAANQLLRYGWPGNVRELENAMERAVALSVDDRTELDELPEDVRQAQAGPQVVGEVKTLAAIEKDYILASLLLHDGNQTRTAQALDIGTATLYRKLRQYGALRGK